MAQATVSFRISNYIRNPVIRTAFKRAERDLPPTPVVADRPRPVLNGSNAVRVLEVA